MKNKRKTLLWRIIPADSRNSYLFGTMHVRDEAAYGYFEQVKPFIRETEIYAAEMDLDQAFATGQLRDACLPDGGSLRDLIPEKKYRKLERILLKAFGLQLGMMDRLYPLFIVNQIAEAQLTRNYADALDQSMWNYAKNLGKEMIGVESYAEQVHILHKLPLDAQVKQLLEIGRNPAKIRRTTRKLIRYYTQMDLQEMYRFSKKGMGKLRRKLIYERNRRMVRKILSLVHDKSCFIAVGAGHLAGEKGLLHELRLSGVIVQPVPLVESGLDSP